MKKILILFIGVLLLTFIFIFALKGLTFGNFEILSVKSLKNKNTEFELKVEEATKMIDENFVVSVKSLKDAEAKLLNVKEEYDKYIDNNSISSVTQIEKYKMEYLWIILGNYAKEEGLRVYMEIQETYIESAYNIVFTVEGSYIGVTNFLYDIENDDELNYRISAFSIQTFKPNNTVELRASFTVENVFINFNQGDRL